ncbi:unnamed protein product [Dicrocoelium dendriticum]|nr:unnamed protein product [Dicrocoelium dendriticum]
MSALHLMDSSLPLPRVEDTGVQTSLAAGVNEWNRSQSPKAVSSTPLVSIGTHSESESPKTEIRQDLISFADWPNVTRLLSSSLNKQQAVHAQFAPSKEDNSNNPFPVTAFIPISTLTDPFANITSASGEFPRPLSSSHEPPLSSGISHASRISVNGAQTNKAHVATESLDRLTQRSDRLTVHFPSTTTVITSDCLQPIRIGDSPVCRAAADVDAAIASVLSAAFPPQTTSDEIATGTVVFAGSSRNRTSAQPDQGSRFGPDNKSIKNAVQTTSPTIFPKLSLHLPPILDIPWEEPDVSDDVLECNQGKTTNSNGLTTVPSTLDATSRAPTCFNNPFLTAPFNESIVHSIPMMHSPDVSTFCSAACCQHSSKPVVVAGRNAWADAFCHEDAQLVYDDLPPSNFLLDAQNVVLLERLGGGNFGHVVRGVYRTSTGQEVPVAVKTLKANQIAAVGEREILVEAKTMAQLRHRHIVRLIGVCKEEQFMLILELVPLGPINKYLKKRQDVSVHTLTELMHQVALGMAYLESCKFVHRDLAARNVLLVNRHFAKISDFGMSKALKFGSDYYRASTVGKWPLKWYAPECIYYFRFDTKSDVWSYGITLWEVYSYGERPYRGMKGAQILAMLDQGLRLSKPSRCPDSIYSIMQQCWNFDGARRPTFSDIVLAVSRVLSHLTMPSRNTHRIGESVRSIPSGSTFGQMRRSDTGTSGSGGSGVNSESSDRTSF